MKKKWLLMVVAVALLPNSFSSEYVRLSKKTALGLLEVTEKEVRLSGNVIVQAAASQVVDSSIWVRSRQGLMGSPSQPVRLLVAESDGCDRGYKLVDLTGDEVFITPQFGQPVKNHVGCLEFSSVDWRKREAIIYLRGFTFKYNYKNRAIIGPVEDFDN